MRKLYNSVSVDQNLSNYNSSALYLQYLMAFAYIVIRHSCGRQLKINSENFEEKQNHRELGEAE